MEEREGREGEGGGGRGDENDEVNSLALKYVRMYTILIHTILK